MDPWRDDVIEAVRKLYEAGRNVEVSQELTLARRWYWCKFLTRAISHIAYPDRDVYPKVRHGSKRNPVKR